MGSALQLGTICEITPGFQFRGRVEPIDSGGFRVIQMKDIEQGYASARLAVDQMTVTNDYGFQDKHLARTGDVVFCARGNNNFSLNMQEPPENTVVSAQFFVLRCDEKALLPGYLFWYLNSSKAQRILSGIRRGTTTPIVTTKALTELEIPVPDIKTQRLTAEVYRLQLLEKELICTIQKKQDELIETRLFQKAEGIEK